MDAALNKLAMGKYSEALLLCQSPRRREKEEGGDDQEGSRIRAIASCVEIQCLFELDRRTEALDRVEKDLALCVHSFDLFVAMLSLCIECKKFDLARKVFSLWQEQETSCSHEEVCEATRLYVTDVLLPDGGMEDTRKFIESLSDDELKAELLDLSATEAESALAKEKEQAETASTTKGSEDVELRITPRREVQVGGVGQALKQAAMKVTGAVTKPGNLVVVLATLAAVVLHLHRHRIRRFFRQAGAMLLENLLMSLGLDSPRMLSRP